MKTLVAGWFSFEHGHATAGDLLAAELSCDWLESAGHPFDIAVDPPFQGGINWRLADPNNYSQVVFVCGPFQKGTLEAEFLAHFAGCRLIGLDLTMLVPLDEWNPFDVLLERDSSVCARPDITFLSPRELVPVVGVCLVEPYGAMEEVAHAAIWRLVASREMSVVKIDTRLDTNSTGLRSPSEIESLLARMDVVVTTRLHGTVLALKNGVPTISIDPEAGGAKIIRQAEKIGWPVAFAVDAVTDEGLQKAFDYCLTEDARANARKCCERATKMVEEARDEFIAALGCSSELDRKDIVCPPAFTNSAENSKNKPIKRISVNSNYITASNKQASRAGRVNAKRLLKFIARLTLPVPVRPDLDYVEKGNDE